MAAIDSQSHLFQARMPPEVKILIKASHSMEKAFFRRLIKLALGYLHGGEGAGQEAALDHLCNLSKATTEEQTMAVCVQYTGVVSLLKAVLRLSTITNRQDSLVAELATLGLPGEFAVDVGRVVFGAARPDIDRQLVANAPSLPTLAHMCWRVDVTISTSWLSRVLEPVVEMRLEMSTGVSHTFQIPINKFHLLRFTVANLLHQIATLQASSICKKQ